MLKVVAVVSLCLLPACDDHAAGFSRLGIRLDGASVVVRYVSCEGEDVESATLFQSDGDNVAPDDGDVRLWESTSLDLVALVGAGVTPESEGREISLDPDEEYLVVVKTSANLAASYVFDSGVLTSDGYWVEGRNLSDADFAKLAAESCFRQP